jgi:hypothetical protein
VEQHRIWTTAVIAQSLLAPLRWAIRRLDDPPHGGITEKAKLALHDVDL